MAARITSFVLGYSRYIVVAAILLTAASVAVIPGIPVENKRGAFSLPDDDPVAQSVETYRGIFGYHEPLYILIKADSVLRPELLSLLHSFVLDVRSISGVQKVRSVFDGRKGFWLSSLGSFKPKILPMFDSLGNNILSMDEIAGLLATEGLYNQTLVSQERGFLAVVVEFEGLQRGGVHSAEDRSIAVEAVLQRLQPISDRYSIALAGQPIIDRDLQKTLRTSLKIFAPVSLAVIVVLMALVFRDRRTVVLLTGLSAATAAITLALIRITGGSLSLTTSMIIPLTMSTGAAYSMHYLDFFQRQHRITKNVREVITQMMAAVFKPSILCGVTTLIGFLALCASRLWITRNFGIYMAAGIAVCMLMTSVVLPALLYLYLRPESFQRRTLERLATRARRVGDFSWRHFGWVTLGIVAVVVITLIGTARLKLETNMMEYFADSSPVVMDYRSIDSVVAGTLPVDIIVDLPDDSLGAFAGRTLQLRDSLKSIQGFGSSTSLFDFLQLLEDAKSPGASPIRFPFSLSERWFRPSLWTFLQENDDLSEFFQVRDSRALIRFAGRLRLQGSSGQTEVLDQIRRVAAILLPGHKVDFAGPAALFVRMQEYVIGTQIASLSVSFLAVAVLFVWISGRWRSGLAAVVSNSLAILVVIGFMGYAGIPLDVVTVMIAAVAITIAADDTIHFLVRYKTAMITQGSRDAAIGATFDTIGAPVIVTSVLLTCGFGVLGLADFVPIRYFGLLTAMIVVLALVADLFLIPALIHLVATTDKTDS